MVSQKIAIVPKLFTNRELVLHEYVVLYWTMDLDYNYKGNADEVEKNFHKTYWMLWSKTNTSVFSLNFFFFINVKKLWSTLGDNPNQFSSLIITFGEHKAVNLHVLSIYISVPNNSACYIGPQSILVKHYSSNIVISFTLVINFSSQIAIVPKVVYKLRPDVTWICRVILNYGPWLQLQRRYWLSRKALPQKLLNVVTKQSCPGISLKKYFPPMNNKKLWCTLGDII